MDNKPYPTDGLEYRGGKEVGHVKPDRDWPEQDNNTDNQSQESGK